GEPAYFAHVMGAARGIMSRAGMTPADFRYVVFHQPNGKFPLRVGEMLGFTKTQIEPGWLVPKLGNTYSGSSPLGLTATLDIAKAADTILLVSYGSGAGSDAFVIRVTERIDEVRDLAPRTRKLLDSNKVYLDYGVYAKYRRKIRKAK
ncbi:MAG: 3-oxoacyl-[acyl-carrier-protein] synthase III C-terminal domain-containing protein, partial [Candidatus Aminicenantales bacterium]